MKFTEVAGTLLVTMICAHARAEQSPSPNEVQIRISPECKQFFYLAPGEADNWVKMPDDVPWDPDHAKPFSFVDRRSLITFYVESDGRHLAAIEPSGRLLWVRTPFEDARLCPIRSPRPIIAEIEVANVSQNYAGNLFSEGALKFRSLGMDDPTHKYLRIHFDSSQFGLLDESTGNFFPEGQN